MSKDELADCARCGRLTICLNQDNRCFTCQEAVKVEQTIYRHTLNMRTEHPNPSDMADAIRFLLERIKP